MSLATASCVCFVLMQEFPRLTIGGKVCEGFLAAEFHGRSRLGFPPCPICALALSDCTLSGLTAMLCWSKTCLFFVCVLSLLWLFLGKDFWDFAWHWHVVDLLRLLSGFH